MFDGQAPAQAPQAGALDFKPAALGGLSHFDRAAIQATCRELENIERLTKQKFEIAKVPTVADLRIRQIEMTVNAVREALSAVDLEDFNAVLHALAAGAAWASLTPLASCATRERTEGAGAPDAVFRKSTVQGSLSGGLTGMVTSGTGTPSMSPAR